MSIHHKHFDVGPSKKIQEASSEWTFLTMPKVPMAPKKNKRNKWTIVPFAACGLILMLLVQSLNYLSSARSAQGEILGAATSAYEDLSAASANLKDQNFADAQLKFSDALTNLQSAHSKLDRFKALQLVATQAKSANHVLSGASLLAQAGGKLSSALSLFGELKVSSQGVETANLSQRISQNKELLTDSLTLLKQAQIEFDAVSDLPGDYAATLDEARGQVRMLTGMLTKLSNLQEIYIGFFGSGPKVYLLIFQNYDEVRATGGFIGTYGVIKINDGKIQSLKIDSIYDLDGRIFDRYAAPGPFQPEIKKWGIRDANWFADFPTSSRKLLQFFESGSETADGVIAFTPALFSDLLTLTGPIEMSKYKTVLTAENFQDIVQYKTSVDYDKKLNEPKQMLADFAPVLLDRLSHLTQEQWLEMLQIMQNNLGGKHMLLYSKEPKLQAKIQELRVAGEILDTDHDYLNIVNTNLSGTKTDLEVKQTANLMSKILSDGTIMDTLTLARTNETTEKNLSYVRVYVPLGSSLVSSSGFDPGQFYKSSAEGFETDPDLAIWDEGELIGRTYVRTESGKTQFAGWLNLEAGESKTVTLTYMIPYKAKTNFVQNNTVYSLLFQKQNGVRPYEFTAELDAGNLKPYWFTSDVGLAEDRVKFNYTTNSDQYWAVLLSR